DRRGTQWCRSWSGNLTCTGRTPLRLGRLEQHYLCRGRSKDADKTLPRALVLGTGVVCLLYFLTNVVYLLLLPFAGVKDGATTIACGIEFATNDRVGTAALEVIFGPIGQQIMAVAIMISVFGALNGLILSGPRLYYAMARDRLFFAKAGVLHARTNVPVFG